MPQNAGYFMFLDFFPLPALVGTPILFLLLTRGKNAIPLNNIINWSQELEVT